MIGFMISLYLCMLVVRFWQLVLRDKPKPHSKKRITVKSYTRTA